MKTLKSNISEAYKVQVDCLKDSESDSYDKNDMKEKVNDLVRLHEAMQEKLKTASYLEPIQILTLVPDKWSRMYCSEYLNIFEYLVWTSYAIKKVGGMLGKPAPKKGKTITTETLHLVTFVKMTISVGRCLKRKTKLVWVKEYINKNFATCKRLCNLHKLYTVLKEKHLSYLYDNYRWWNIQKNPWEKGDITVEKLKFSIKGFSS